MGSVMKGTGLYLAGRGCDEIISSFVVTRTNLFPSYYITHAEGTTNFQHRRKGDASPNVTPQ